MYSGITVAQSIGRSFAVKLENYLTPRLFYALRVANGLNEGSGTCASHDYCDPNMLMLEAMEQHMGPMTVEQIDPRMWDQAWVAAGLMLKVDEAELVAEYEAFLQAECLPVTDAEELIQFHPLTASQKAWVAWFIQRWEVVATLAAGADRVQ